MRTTTVTKLHRSCSKSNTLEIIATCHNEAALLNRTHWHHILLTAPNAHCVRQRCRIMVSDSAVVDDEREILRSFE
jgi:hypothetical protein